MRIVSLTCSNTEIVCALGAGSDLVGLDDHSDFPREILGLPRVGPDLSVDVERIADLRPDLVLASLTVPGHERNVAALEARGLPFLAPEPQSLSDVYENIALIGDAIGRSREAADLVARMQAEMPKVRAEVRPRVVVEWWPKPVIVPGRKSWVSDLIDAAGGMNPLAERAVKSAPITDQELCALEPDALVISWCGVKPEKYRPEVVLRRPGFAALEAARRGCVFAIPEAFLGRPGPRLLDGYRALRDVIELCAQRGVRATPLL